MSCVILAFTGLTLALPAAAPTAGSNRQLTAVRVEQAPAIDGVLADQVWSRAVPSDAFVQRYPDEGAAPTERTEVRVLFDDEAVYVAVRCFDRDPPSLARPVSRRDAVPESDSVTLAFDSMHDHASGRSFTVNAAGVVAEALIYDDTQSNDSWDAVWDAAVSTDSEGWSAELAIPFRVLRYSPDLAEWGLQLTRKVFRRGGRAALSGGRSFELRPPVGAAAREVLDAHRIEALRHRRFRARSIARLEWQRGHRRADRRDPRSLAGRDGAARLRSGRGRPG